MPDAYDDCLDAIKEMGNCPVTLAMQNHKVLGSSLTVLDWVRATLLDLEVEINAQKTRRGKNMTDDRDICERLEDPSYDGAIYMRQDAAKEIRALRAKIAEQEEWNSLRAMDIVTLGLEVGRLWEAIEEYVNTVVKMEGVTFVDQMENSELRAVVESILAKQKEKP